MSLRKLRLSQRLFVAVNKILAEYLTLLGRTGGIHLNGSVSWTELAFKHSPQIFYSVEVGALGRSFQQLYVRLFYQFQNRFCCLLGIIDLLEHSLVSRFQSPPMTMTSMSMMNLFLDQWQTCDLPEFCISLNGC